MKNVLCLGRSISVGHALDVVATLLDAHDGHADYFAHSFAQVLVARGNYVALVLGDSLHDAVVGIGALVHAGQALEARIFGYAQRDPVRLAELLELGHHAVAYVGYALGIHAVHHGLDDVQLVLDGEVDEVRVDEDVIRRAELGVVREEESARRLGQLLELQLVRIDLGRLGRLAVFGLS